MRPWLAGRRQRAASSVKLIWRAAGGAANLAARLCSVRGRNGLLVPFFFSFLCGCRCGTSVYLSIYSFSPSMYLFMSVFIFFLSMCFIFLVFLFFIFLFFYFFSSGCISVFLVLLLLLSFISYYFLVHHLFLSFSPTWNK